MPIQYRKLKKGEENAVLDLWVTVFKDDRSTREQLLNDFTKVPNRGSRTFVAVDQDEKPFAAASYWLRSIRDNQGHPQKTGHVWGVATHPEHRQRGHATQLMQHLIHSMREEGCVWSILFAQDEARSLYSGLGWQPIPSRYLGGLLSDAVIPLPENITVRGYDPLHEPFGWEPVAKVYQSFNATRPLSQIRDTPYWNGYINWMYSDWQEHHHAKILIAEKKTESKEVCGYALVHFYNAEYAKTNFNSPPWFYISEIGAMQNESEAMLSLLIAIAQEAKALGLGYGQMALPNEPWMIQSLERVFAFPLEVMENEGSTMIKSISPQMAKFVPESYVWEMDRF